MATMIKCDRCGLEEETKGTQLAVNNPLITAMVPSFRETTLPHDWRRPTLPQRDGSAWKRDLCPGCVNALYDFMEGDGAVAGLLAVETLAKVQEALDDTTGTHADAVARAYEALAGESQIDQSTIRVSPVRKPEPCPDGQHQVQLGTPENVAGPCMNCGWTYAEVMTREPEQDPRPNLTARAEKIAAVDGAGDVKMIQCTHPGAGKGYCDGWYLQRYGYGPHVSAVHAGSYEAKA